MTTSGTTLFDCTRDEIISDALASLGAIGPGKTATGAPLLHAARALNRLVKAIDADGEFLWRSVRRSVTLTSGTATYTLAADVLDVDEPLSYKPAASTSRSPIRLMSGDDYRAITDRTVTGRPTQAYLELALPTTVTLSFWPTPDTTSDTIEYSARIRAQDYSTGANTGDYPARWLDCLVQGLTWRLAMTYGKTAMEAVALKKEFEAEKERQLNAGGERGGFRLVPWGAGGGW